MANVIRSGIRTALLVGFVLAVSTGPARAQCLGDCDGSGSVGAGDLTKIIAIINYCPCSGQLIGGAAARVLKSPRRCAATPFFKGGQ